MVNKTKEGSVSLSRDLSMILLAIVSIALLIFEASSDLTEEQNKVFLIADFIIAIIFLAEYLYGIIRAERKWHYAITHWYDLISSIPITSESTRVLRGIRVARIFRAARLFRLVRLKKILKDSNKFATESKIIYIGVISFTIIIFCSLTFHYYEFEVNSNVGSYFDSFWWAMTTITTVGYGDIVPMTIMGRIMAIILMLVGIGTLGTLTYSIAGYVLREQEKGGHMLSRKNIPIEGKRTKQKAVRKRKE
ncbi:potassium channel family protein [Patescibacteria group bacterium]|nr:potassium channel family protein [Patescibacteria group bacterium]MBU1075197.1 potassium channel family protein [Patescibacteria group bacterium]MBU1952137.1 potassium channel family protein [Patescibacteria group bacterium]